jgi:hypothetical protein
MGEEESAAMWGSKGHLMDCPDTGFLSPQCDKTPRPLPHPSRH